MTVKNANETREQKFKRIAQSRTNSIIDKLRLLGNCSNRRLYTYSEEEVDRIFSVINKQVKVTRLKFDSQRKEQFRF